MARKTNKTSGNDKAPDETLPAEKVEDAVVVSEETAPEGDADSTATDVPLEDPVTEAGDTRDDEVSETPEGADRSADEDTTVVAEATVDDAVIGPDDKRDVDAEAVDPVMVEDAAQTEDPVHDTIQSEPEPKEPVGTAVAPAPPPQVIEKRGPGFVPLVLGGLIAGGIGYAIPTFMAPEDVAGPDGARIASLETELQTLQSDFATLTPGASGNVDLGGIETAQADLTARVEEIEAQVAGLQEQTTAGPVDGASTANVAAAPALAPEIETLRSEIGSLSDRVAGLDGTTTTLGEDIASLRDDLDGRVTSLEGGLTELRDRSAAVADDAEALAREAAANQVRIALDSGAPYAEPLAVLGDAPAALATSAETGVATTADLSGDFPPLAREALRVSRSPGEGGVGDALGSLFNARSLEPQEGDGPDAVLSRAEAAMRAGDVETALTEIDALPQTAKDVLADWTARAEARRDARAALQDYLQDE